jgi:sporulation protein YlmC with PRC-barrel domain
MTNTTTTSDMEYTGPKIDATPRVLRARSIIGDRVHNALGEHLGHIEDLMIDLKKGHIMYCVLSFGGFLGFGNKLFAVPLEIMKYDVRKNQFVLDVEKEILEKAPGFDKDHWPDFSNEAYGMEIQLYYGTVTADDASEIVTH